MEKILFFHIYNSALWHMLPNNSLKGKCEAGASEDAQRGRKVLAANSIDSDP